MTTKKYFFDHIPKCGGTSVNAIFRRLYHDRDITSSISAKAGDLFARGRLNPLISGHITFAPGDSLEQDRYALTMLRDPIDRVISLFYFWKNNPEAQRYMRVEVLGNMTFRDFVFSADSRFESQISNYQTNHFLNLEYDGSKVITDEKKLEAAKMALGRYNLVGVQDLLEDFVFILSWENDWPSYRSIPEENKTIDRPTVLEVEPDVIQRLRELNELDFELVAYARKRFLEHKNRVLNLILDFDTLPREMDNLVVRERAVDQPARTSIDMGTKEVEIVSVRIEGSINRAPPFLSGETLRLELEFASHVDASDLTVGIRILTPEGLIIFGVNSRLMGYQLSIVTNEKYQAVYTFRNDLGMGHYRIDCSLHKGSNHSVGCFHWKEDVATFDVYDNLGSGFDGILRLYPDFACYRHVSVVTEDETCRLPIKHFGPTNLALSEFSARIIPLVEIPEMKARETVGLMVEITNCSAVTWPSVGQCMVSVSYHWLNESGDNIHYEGLRTMLPRDVTSGETVRVSMVIRAPDAPGPAQLQLALVQESIAWFDDKGCCLGKIPVAVTG